MRDSRPNEGTRGTKSSIDPKSVTADVLSALMALSDPQRAINEKKYQKSELDFLGVTVPGIRSVSKSVPFVRRAPDKIQLWQVVHELWKTSIWEMRFVAILMLENNVTQLTREDLPVLKSIVNDAACWAMNDWIGCHIVGSIVVRDPSALSEMDTWAKDTNIWIRRVSMQSLLLSMRAGNMAQWPRFVRYAEPALEAKDFWTRKVIGWILREVSKKNPGPVFEFLMVHRNRVSGLTLREGSKYLSADQRCELGLVS